MTINIYTSKKSGKTFSTPQGFLNHLFKIYPDKNAEEIYLEEIDDTFIKCIYCENRSKFKSIFKGYGKICTSKECKRAQYCEINQQIADNLVRGIPGYDELILSNLELFISAFSGNQIIDPLDGYLHQTTRFITHRSESNLKDQRFFETRCCIVCGNSFSVNFVRKHNKRCCSNDCERRNNLNIAKSKVSKLTNIDEFVLRLRSMSNLEFSKQCSEKTIPYFPGCLKDDIVKYEIWKSFKKSFPENRVFFDEKSGLYCNIIPCRNSSIFINDTIKQLVKIEFLNLNDYVILVDDCSVCGNLCETKKFNYWVDLDNNFIFSYESKYSYCSSKCYREFQKTGNLSLRYIYSEERKKKQSKDLKTKILSGEFTPNSTNSWCFGRIEYQSFSFRSSWELLFYFYARKNYEKILFEKIRIPYFDSSKNIDRVYIVDFFLDNRYVVEVKPESKLLENSDKLCALTEFAKHNSYNIIICDENFFRCNLTADIFDEINSDDRIDCNIKKRISKYRKILLCD